MQDALRKQAGVAFRGWPHLHTTVISTKVVNDASERAQLLPGEVERALLQFNLSGLADGFGKSASKNKHYVTNAMATSSLVGWVWQFAHLAAAEKLRRQHGPHDLIIRARLDVLLQTPLPQHLLRREHVRLSQGVLLALGFRAYTSTPRFAFTFDKCHLPGDKRSLRGVDQLRAKGADITAGAGDLGASECHAGAKTQWYWRDWMFVGTAETIAPLASMVDKGGVLADPTLRVIGLGQEEQTVLHLRASNVVLDILDWEVKLVRISCKQAEAARPMLPGEGEKVLAPCKRCG